MRKVIEIKNNNLFLYSMVKVVVEGIICDGVGRG